MKSDDLRRDMVNIDVAAAVLVADEVKLDDGTPGEVTVVERRPGALVFTANVPGRQMLVVTERFHSGWTVQVDDGPSESPRRVNGDFMGCVLEPGKHRVTMRFAPASFARGLLLTQVTCGCLLVVAIALCLRPKRAANDPAGYLSSRGPEPV